MELGGTIEHKQMMQALMHKILTPRFIDYINVSIIDMEWLHCNTGEDGLFFSFSIYMEYGGMVQSDKARKMMKPFEG